MAGAIIPVIKTPDDLSVAYASDFFSPLLFPYQNNIDVLVLDSSYYNSNFTWKLSREETTNNFFNAFADKWRGSDFVCITGSSGHIEEMISLISNRVSCPFLLSPKLNKTIQIYSQYLGFSADTRLYNSENYRILKNNKEKFIAFFDIEDRRYLELDPKFRISVDNNILPSSKPTQLLPNGQLRVSWPNRADFSRIISFVNDVKPKFVVTTNGVRGGNSGILAEYIKNELQIAAAADFELNSDSSSSSYIDLRSDSLHKEPSVKPVRQLIVYVSCEFQTRKDWKPLIQELEFQSEFAETDWLPWDRLSKKAREETPRELAMHLKAQIDEIWAAKASYERLILIGHGVGGLLVRQAYLFAAGAYPNYPESPWCSRVERLVLFSVSNRGIDPSRFKLTYLTSALEKISTLNLKSIFSLNQYFSGSDFVTNLKIDWIRHFSKPAYILKVIHLFSIKDGEHIREDNIDPNPYYIDIPVANPDSINKVVNIEGGERRLDNIKSAIVSESLPSARKEVIMPVKDDVIFILHGIRDSNRGWAKELEELILSQKPNSEIVRASYGYFSALNFFLPGIRKRNINWFKDQYGYYFARHPESSFHFIGHSNGTYIFGNSLTNVPRMKFVRAYLAGSVLPRKYPWRERFDKDQIKLVRNDCSAFDWPVGLLCSGLRGIGMSDIGTGGFDGFINFSDRRLQEIQHFNGGHGEPLSSCNQKNIVDFILTGNVQLPDNLLPKGEERKLHRFQYLSRLAPRITLVLFCVIGFLLFLYLSWIISDFRLFKVILLFTLVFMVRTILETL